MTGTVGSFDWSGRRIVYETHGAGPRVFVFMHGLLLDAALNRTIARLLAERGHRVVLPDLLGHGRSDRPADPGAYRAELWAEQAAALLDHLGVDEAVVGGVSLGANIGLQLALDHPERVRALVVEMPVLERGTLMGAATFFPLLFGMRYAPSVFRPVGALARRLPALNHPVDAFVHLAAAQPRQSAAVLLGLFVGPTAPPPRSRRGITAPTLILGHARGVLHPLDDAQTLSHELPNATFVQARSVIEARTRPQRVVDELDRFLTAAWADAAVPAAGAPGA